MSALRLLALSSSRVGNSAYLKIAAPVIKTFLGNKRLTIAFIPFAAVDNNFDEYVAKVREGLAELPHHIVVVKPGDAASIIQQADVIMTGGGNTFKLLHDLYEYELVELIAGRVRSGTHYIGWSAGSNIAGLTIGTTNDMPIVEPQSFKAFGFLPFQINPHYMNVKPEGHNGETRDERLSEYLQVNPAATIVGLPEGTALHLEGNTLQLTGVASATVFRSTSDHRAVTKTTISSGEDICWLL